jgi:hypothetical protein
MYKSLSSKNNKNRNFLGGLVIASALLSVIPAANSQTVLTSIDFETAGDFTNNFRFTSNPSASTQTQTSNGVANDYVATFSSAGSVNARTAVFDSGLQGIANQNLFSPLSSAGIKISLDIRASSAGSSFGIFIVNPTEGTANTHPLALFSWDTSAANDRFRLFGVAQISGNGVGTAIYDSATSNSGSAVGDNTFVSATLIYRQDLLDLTKPIYNFTVGSVSTGDIAGATGTYLSSFEVGVRSTDGNSTAVAPSTTNTTDFDNFVVTDLTVVPEPSTWLGAGLILGLVSWSQRRRFIKIA